MKAFIVNIIIKLTIKLTLKIDRESRKEFRKIQKKGPALIITNHVSNMEGPIIYEFLRPRRAIALGKMELWEKWITRQAMESWECIPISRGGVDQNAITACKKVLEEGDFLCIAPEGTRSKTGKMQQAKPGITLFIRPDIPVIPVATCGLENYAKNLKKLRRTPIKISIGEPFYPVKPEGRLTGEKRQEMVDSIMKKVAEMLPQEYRGYYDN
jgi:1-acyl-sn-glycerol-3-phosphate acyltransferase